MLWGEDHVGGAEKGVRSGGKYLDLCVVSGREGKSDARALGPPDPVTLEHLDPFGPVEILQLVDEPLRVCSNSEHPLLERPPLYGVPLLFPLRDFLIGEDRSKAGAPVHGSLCDIGESHIIDLFLGPALLF